MNCKSIQEAVLYQTQGQLLSGWNVHNKTVVNFELTSAGRRCGIDLDKTNFILPPESSSLSMGDEEESMSLKRWEAFLAYNGVSIDSLNKCNSKRNNGRHILPIRTLLDALIEFAYKKAKPLWFLAFLRNTLILSVAILSIALSVTWYDGYDVWVVVFHICSTIIIVMYGYVNLAFIEAATFDAQRRLLVAKTLSLLIRIQGIIDYSDELDFGSFVANLVPKLDLDSDATNPYAWLFVRLVMQNYGKRALFRMELYLGKILNFSFNYIFASFILYILIFIQECIF